MTAIRSWKTEWGWSVFSRKRSGRRWKQSPKTDIGRRRVSIATGCLAAPVIKQLSDLVCETYSGLEVTVHAIENRFFGERITVFGADHGTGSGGAAEGQRSGRGPSSSGKTC